MPAKMLGANWKVWKLHGNHNPHCYCGTLGWGKGKNDSMKREIRSREKREVRKEIRDQL